MLPPHRPFRDQPAPEVKIASKTKWTNGGQPTDTSVRGIRKDLKPALLIVDRTPPLPKSIKSAIEVRS